VRLQFEEPLRLPGQGGVGQAFEGPATPQCSVLRSASTLNTETLIAHLMAPMTMSCADMKC
jgi:hypothetical protein